MPESPEYTAERPRPADGEAQLPAGRRPGGGRATAALRQVTVANLLHRVQVVIIAPFAILLVISVGSFVYGGYLTVRLVLNTSWGSSGASDNIVKALQVIDVCLIGIAALVIAAESLVMFMSPSSEGTAPRAARWLESDAVETLKNRALSLVVLIIVVTFLEGLVHPQPGRSELRIGIAIATVIAAIALYLFAGRCAPRRLQRGEPPNGPPGGGQGR